MSERKEFSLKIIQKKQEAKEAVSLFLEVPKELQNKFKFIAGQFVGVTASIEGKQVHRSYSISSDPFDLSQFSISIKKIPQGKMSTHLVDQVQKGDELLITPPAGQFYKEQENKKHHIMFAAGSGVTPMVSILKHLQRIKPQEHITLFYWNKSLKETMFLKELEVFSESRFVNVFLNFTQENPQHELSTFTKRVNPSLLKECFLKWSVTLDMPLFYLCGPESFMQEVEAFLGAKGFDRSQVRKESFGGGVGAAPPASVSDSKERFVGDKNTYSNSPETCIGLFDGERVEVNVSPDESLLESFLQEGESPPYSCMEGTCMACQCKVVEGLVSVPKESFLSEEEMEEGLVLACQAKAQSRKVKIDFEDI